MENFVLNSGKLWKIPGGNSGKLWKQAAPISDKFGFVCGIWHGFCIFVTGWQRCRPVKNIAMKARIILTGEISSMCHIKRNFFNTDAEFHAVRNHFTAEFEMVKDAQQALRIAAENLRRYCDGEEMQPDIYRRNGRIESISFDAANVQIFRT